MNKDYSFFKKNPNIMAIGIMLLGVGMKIALLATGRMPFNADEAIVGLMASHILDGELPIFFWGQSYMGSLDAFLVAGAFLLIGKSVLAIRVVQILLFCGILLTTYHIAQKSFGSVDAGWMAALLIAIPTVNVTLYTTISLGGYGEALLMGNLIILAGLRTMNQGQWFDWMILGLLAGVGLWVNGLTLVYSLPVIIISFWQMLKISAGKFQNRLTGRLLLVIAAVILGALPWWIYGMQYGFQSVVTELMGSAINNPEMGYLGGIGLRIVSFLLFGVTVIFGFRPPWEIRWLVLPMIPLIITVWVLIMTGFRKFIKTIPQLKYIGAILLGILVTLTIAFILTSFGNDPSGRYFLPIWIILSIIAGISLTLTKRLGIWRWGILIILVLFNLGGTIQCWLKTPPGFTTQFDATTIFDHRYFSDLESFLRENDINMGYTTYWIAYPLAFYSDEELIFVPRLPYHKDFGYTSRDDRYPAYDVLVEMAGDVGYITARQPWLDDYLRKRFSSLGVEWQETIIGDFNVFYQLTEPVSPKDIGLRESTIAK